MAELRTHQFLAFFDEDSAQQLADAAEILTLETGATIFREGDVADSIYLVLKGSVRLTKKDPAGKEQLLAIVKENDYFGEFGVLDNKPRSAGAIAAGEANELARLPGSSVKSVFMASGADGMLKVALHIIHKVRETNERYVEERLRKERMTLIGEMADTIIHDLKNPVCVIQLAVDMLRRTPPATAGEHCDLIETQLTRILTLVEEILEFSRGRPQIRPKAVSLQEFLQEFGRLNEKYVTTANVELVVEPISRMLEIDPHKMTRVLQNLVGNAVEAFAGKGGKVVVRAEDQNGGTVISVADNGPGIPKDMQASLFEPFTTRGKRKGTGLGMAIAKSIVEAHGGELTLQTLEQQGTTFFIRLPPEAAQIKPRNEAGETIA